MTYPTLLQLTLDALTNWGHIALAVYAIRSIRMYLEARLHTFGPEGLERRPPEDLPQTPDGNP